MRILIALLAALPLLAQAQLYGQPQDSSGLYPYKKQMPPATVIESQGGGIPTDGTAMGRQMQNEQRSRQQGGPTMIYREPGKGKPTIITGPNGTTVCTDANGRTTVCW